VNVGLENTSEQMINFLNKHGSLSSNVWLKTDIDQDFLDMDKDLKESYENLLHIPI